MGSYKLLEKAKLEFAKKRTLLTALNFLARDAHWVHDYYQHYARLERVLDKIKGKWWFNRSDSVRLNDHHEFAKYGVIPLYSKTYQTSFCHGKAEDAAMWGLYARNDKTAVRITISKKIMRRWISSLRIDRSMSLIKRKKGLLKAGIDSSMADKIRMIDMRDVVYVASNFRHDKKDEYSQDRYNKASWEGVFAHSLRDLCESLEEDWVVAMLKDLEWRHERESRIIIGFDQTASCTEDSLAIDIPDYVVKDMRFTFSPWLDDAEFEDVRAQIEQAYRDANIDIKDTNGLKSLQRFRRSNLQGALNFQ